MGYMKDGSGRRLDSFDVAESRASGLVIPKGWGSNSRAKIASGGPLHIAVQGDSLTQGAFASSLRTKAWSPLLAAEMQTTLGDGGSGFFGTSNSSLVLTAVGMAAGAVTAYGSAGDLWTLTGSWSAIQGSAPQYQSIRSSTSGDSATSPTGALRGRYIDIFTRGSGGAFNYTYSIDGGTAVTVNAATGVSCTTVDTGSTGTHTITITHTDAVQMDLPGVRARNTTGVWVDRYATYGIKSAAAANLSGGTSGAWGGGTLDPQPAQLVIYYLGANDLAQATALSTVAGQVQSAFDGYLDNKLGGSAQGNVDLAIVIPHIGRFDNATTPGFASWVASMNALARTYNAAVVDLFALGHRSWGWMTAQGYVGNPASLGAGGTDPVHLSDAGYLWVKNQIASLLHAATIY